MRKKLVVFVLVILVFLSSNPLQSRAYKVNDFASWSFSFYYDYYGETWTFASTNITILDESESLWMVRVIFTDLTEYYETVNSTENIHKQGESGGFVTTETGYYWLLWVDLSQISETSELVASGDFLGIPFITVEGPVTFEVEKGELKIANKIYAVWAFMTDILDLFYDINTGLLLKARYDYDIGRPVTTKLELVNSTILTTKAGTLFTFEVLVISVSIIALVSIWYRKRGKLDKNIGALQQNRIRRN